MDHSRHIWEGWTVQDFIDALAIEIQMVMAGNSWRKPFESKAELEKFCADHQPYYKKPVPEVVDYFARKYRIRQKRQKR